MSYSFSNATVMDYAPTPFSMYAEYEDGTCLYVYEQDEESCMAHIAEETFKRGACTYYTGVTNDYYIDGEKKSEEEM